MLESAGFFCYHSHALRPNGSLSGLNDIPERSSLDDIGLGMAFYKCLSEIDAKDLRVYGAIKQDPQFIQQLIEIYHEISTAKMSFLDLESLTDADKRSDLLLILKDNSLFKSRSSFTGQSY